MRNTFRPATLFLVLSLTGALGIIAHLESPASAQEVAPVAVIEPAVLLKQLVEGTLTPSQAWANGALTLDGLLDLLQRTLPQEQPELRLALTDLLAEHGWERVQPGAGEEPQISDRVRYEVAQAYVRRKDVRGVTLFAQLLQEMREADKPEEIVDRLHRLSDAYNATGQLRLAAETVLQVAPLVREKHPGWASSVHIEAARLYGELGEKE